MSQLAKYSGFLHPASLKWYIHFCIYGQYIREKQHFSLAFNNLFNAFIWIGTALLFSNKVFDTNFSMISWGVFILAFRWGFVSIDRFGDFGLGYSLSDDFPISNHKIAQMRLLSKWIQISEWFFLISAFLFIHSNGMPLFFSICAAVFFVMLTEITEEIVCLVSYKAVHRILFYMLLLILLVWMSWATFSGVLGTIAIDPIFLIMLLVVFLLGAGFLFCYLLYVYRKPRSSRKARGERLFGYHKKYDSRKIVSPLRVLVEKEFLCLLSHKIDVLISAVAFSLIFIFTANGDDMFIPFLPSFFIMDFASSYSSKMFGIEGEDIQITLLSPIPRRQLIRSKNLLFMIVSLIGSSILSLLVFLLGKSSGIDSIVEMMSINALSLAALMAVCPFLSIRYYHPESKKNSHKFVELIILLLVYLVETVSVVGLQLLGIHSFGLIAIGVMMLGISIFATIVQPSFYTDLLEQKEKEILKAIL